MRQPSRLNLDPRLFRRKGGKARLIVLTHHPAPAIRNRRQLSESDFGPYIIPHTPETQNQTPLRRIAATRPKSGYSLSLHVCDMEGSHSLMSGGQGQSSPIRPGTGYKRKRSGAGFESSPGTGPEGVDEDEDAEKRRQPVPKRACNECRQQKVSCSFNAVTRR